eukprot:2449558-Pleurochrysis_carterae.AAC.1
MDGSTHQSMRSRHDQQVPMDLLQVNFSSKRPANQSQACGGCHDAEERWGCHVSTRKQEKGKG